MAILDLFGRKIKAVHYFTENDKQFDLPGIKVQISKLNSTLDISTQSGSGKSHTKITIPDDADKTKLAQLDMMQYQLAKTINTLSKKAKEEKTKEYVNLLFQMFELVSSTTTDIKKKSINNVPVKEIDFKKLNKYLTDREFKSNGLPNDLSTTDGYVIWPITLQPSATYIHTAQIQLIKLFISAGWKLHVIIGDCGKHSATVKDTSEFKKSIISLLGRNDIAINDNTVTFLSKYFKRDVTQTDRSLLQNIDSMELLNTFHNIGESIEWGNYWEYVTKNYNKTKREELKKRKVLSNLQPLLNWAFVVTITQKNKKTIVVAGEDEKEQWDKITSLHGNNKIGMIYIQELKDGTKTMDQSEIGITSEQEMLTKLNNGNMGQWLYNHFVELPYFLKDINIKPSFCKLSDNECSKYGDNCIKCLFDNNCKNFNDVQHFDKNAFVSEIYQIANPN